MTKELKKIQLTKPITVGNFKVEVNDELRAELIKYTNDEIKVRYSTNGASYTTPPIPKEYRKLVWQKAQQQL